MALNAGWDVATSSSSAHGHRSDATAGRVQTERLCRRPNTVHSLPLAPTNGIGGRCARVSLPRRSAIDGHVKETACPSSSTNSAYSQVFRWIGFGGKSLGILTGVSSRATGGQTRQYKTTSTHAHIHSHSQGHSCADLRVSFSVVFPFNGLPNCVSVDIITFVVSEGSILVVHISCPTTDIWSGPFRGASSRTYEGWSSSLGPGVHQHQVGSDDTSRRGRISISSFGTFIQFVLLTIINQSKTPFSPSRHISHFCLDHLLLTLIASSI
ncbi:unnamed protein product [Protopolystoma xenopodis]|uniref:Uncharacterized protein n=1 Tax=Protopolystoma xenopodis TaxID=117903 RepID=A0A448WQ37_9PLAT|nr:unnamed protein product [Protopolystoma xenopodis]